MLHRLRMFGLALTGILAMSVVVASTASAQLGKITSDGPVTLTGSETANGLNRFTAFGSENGCIDHYLGHKTNTTNTLLASGETSVTIRPFYSNCSSAVNPEGCDYAFYDFTTAGVAGTYGLKADIRCPAGVSGVWVDGPFFCDTTIPPQTGISGAHMTNEGGGHIRLSGALKGIRATNSCLGETTEALYHVDVTFRGLNSAGSPTAISISH